MLVQDERPVLWSLDDFNDATDDKQLDQSGDRRRSSAVPPGTGTLLETAFRVVASNGREAIRLVRELRPDVLLLDLVMPVASGLEALRELSTMTLATRTLLLTAKVGDSDIVDALQLGARGVVMKSDTCEMLFKSIRTVMAGQYWVGHECAGNVIDQMRDRASAPGPEPARPTFGLTPRELEVVSTVVGGYPNGDIAQKFSISVKTVEQHLTNIFDKVGVSNRLELALFAVHFRLEARAHAPTSHAERPLSVTRH
jgi:DNA-binding NarL/FixJ family response regulator